MKIEPNSDIGMRAEVILCHNDKIEFTNGEILSVGELKAGSSSFDEFCDKIDPNTTFIDVLMPSPDDRDVFFLLREIGAKHDIHVQNVLLRENEVWTKWQYYKKING
jgi:hypothetical protein